MVWKKEIKVVRDQHLIFFSRNKVVSGCRLHMDYTQMLSGLFSNWSKLFFSERFNPKTDSAKMVVVIGAPSASWFRFWPGDTVPH